MKSGYVFATCVRAFFFFLGLLPGLLFMGGLLYFSWVLFKEELDKGTSPWMLIPAALITLILTALISGRLKSRGPALPQEPSSPPPPPTEPFKPYTSETPRNYDIGP